MVSFMYVEEEVLQVLLAAMPCMGLHGMALLALALLDRMLGVVLGKEGGLLQGDLT